MARPVFIIDGSRTPFLKARSGPGQFTPVCSRGQTTVASRCWHAATVCAHRLRSGDPRLHQCHCRRDEPGVIAARWLSMGEAMVAFTVQISAAPACNRSTPAIAIPRRRPGLDPGRRFGSPELRAAGVPQQGVCWFAGLAGGKGFSASWLRSQKRARLISSRSLASNAADRSDHRTQHGDRPPKWSVTSSGITRAQSDAAHAVESRRALPMPRPRACSKGEVETAFARDGKFYERRRGAAGSSPENWRR